MLGLKEWHGDILMLGTVGGTDTDTDTDNDNDNDTVLCVYRRLLFAVCCLLYVLCCMLLDWIGLDRTGRQSARFSWIRLPCLLSLALSVC
mmetsp:Transcript_10111/g.21413  ORF Transcript_10111/g.21413 Transcript_10111/m.21413 type:complete len:90 (+) Transcript_10111:688-957(+)